MKIEVLIAEVQKDITEPLDGTVRRYAAQTIQHFFRETECYRLSSTYQADGNHLPIDDVEKCYVHSIRTCHYTDSLGWRYKLDQITPECLCGAERAHSVSAFALEDDCLQFDGHAKGTIDLIKVMVPTQDICEIPPMLAAKWFNVLRAGTMGRILAVPMKPWTDVKLAAVYSNMYALELDYAKRDTNKDRGRVKRRVRFNPDFRW